jgi:hypothetical protein
MATGFAEHATLLPHLDPDPIPSTALLTGTGLVGLLDGGDSD